MPITIETKETSKAYAYIYVATPYELETSSTETEYQIVFDTNGISNNCTPDEDNAAITSIVAGTYLITTQLTFTAQTAGDVYVGGIKVDGASGSGDIGGQKAKTRTAVELGGSSHSMTCSALATITAGQDIEFWVKNETTSAETNLYIKTCNMSVIQI